MSSNFEVLVWISNPEDFPSWPQEKKLVRYRRVLDWHDYIADLHLAGKVTHVWGSHELLSRAKFTSSQGLLLAVYNVRSWSEFDTLLLDDPLRDLSVYNTSPLSTLMGDRATDLERYERHKRLFLGDGNSAIRRTTYEAYRARYNLPPEFVGKYSDVARDPPNLPTPLNAEAKPGDPLQILIMGVNPPEYITLWDDARKLVHHEKVTWWHDYMAMLISEGKVSHAWGTNDFCHIQSTSSNSCAAIAIYSVPDFDEFDRLYKLDPIRDATIFWSVLLQPIADQRRLDKLRLERAERFDAVNRPYESYREQRERAVS